tara:strand:+ start:540 stop:737 length:198 start_codon:yes stop_codon:yes gene_type:complete
MKKNTVSKIFNDIENVRKKNNKNWMDLLRLAYNVNPRETVKILTNILNKDQKLITLAKKLKKITK